MLFNSFSVPVVGGIVPVNEELSLVLDQEKLVTDLSYSQAILLKGDHVVLPEGMVAYQADVIFIVDQVNNVRTVLLTGQPVEIEMELVDEEDLADESFYYRPEKGGDWL